MKYDDLTICFPKPQKVKLSLAYNTLDFFHLNTAVLAFLKVNICAVFIPRVCILQLIAEA